MEGLSWERKRLERNFQVKAVKKESSSIVIYPVKEPKSTLTLKSVLRTALAVTEALSRMTTPKLFIKRLALRRRIVSVDCSTGPEQAMPKVLEV